MGSTLATWLLVLGWIPMLFGVGRGRASSRERREREWSAGLREDPSDAGRERAPSAARPAGRPASRPDERPADEPPLRRDRSDPRFGDRIQLLLTWLACIAVTVLAILGLRRSPHPLRVAAGTGLFLAAVGFWLWARRSHGSEYAQLPRVPRVLVTTGPYRAVRHPLYLGTLGAVAGQAIAAGTWPAGAIALALAIQLATRAAREERLLAKSLGAAWRDYADRVRPGIPRL